MSGNIDLQPNEIIVEKVKGDMWDFGQKRGSYIFTNQRVIFTPSSLIGKAKNVEFSYSEIDTLKKCGIGPILLPILPFGIKVVTKEGKKYNLSLLNRNKWFNLIQNS